MHADMEVNRAVSRQPRSELCADCGGEPIAILKFANLFDRRRTESHGRNRRHCRGVFNQNKSAATTRESSTAAARERREEQLARVKRIHEQRGIRENEKKRENTSTGLGMAGRDEGEEGHGVAATRGNAPRVHPPACLSTRERSQSVVGSVTTCWYCCCCCCFVGTG